MKFTDFLGADFLYYNKNAFIAGVSDDLQTALADAKAAILEGNNSAVAAYLAGKATLETILKRTSTGFTTITGSIPLVPNIWTGSVILMPSVGVTYSLMNVQMDCTLPSNSNTCGYIGFTAGNDQIGSPMTLSSMLFYSYIYGKNKPTSFAKITGSNTITISIPMDINIGSKGFYMWTRKTTEAGFTISSIRASYKVYR